MYGGAAVTTKNIEREDGLSTWTEVAGAGTFSKDPGVMLEVVFGQGSDDDKDEPFGCKIMWEVPCSENPTLSAAELCVLGSRGGVVDDAVETDLVETYWDPEDGTAITASATTEYTPPCTCPLGLHALGVGIQVPSTQPSP